MKLNQTLFSEYQKIMTTTSLRAGYQQIWAFMHDLFCALKKMMPDHDFHPRIIENRLIFIYFQFTDQKLKKAGLKIQIVFVHSTCLFEIWMSGYNRKIQHRYYDLISFNQCPFEICQDPKHDDFIAKIKLNHIFDLPIEDVIQQIKVCEHYFLNIEQEKKHGI